MLGNDFRRPMRAGQLAFLAMTALTSLAHPGGVRAAALPKAVAKCQAGLAKGGAKFVVKKLGLLAKCTDGVFKCIQTIDDANPDGAAKRTECITKARAKCGSAIDAVGVARAAFSASATKACAGLDPAQLTGGDGLGFAATCTDFGGAPVTDLASLSACLAKGHDCLAGEIFQLAVPRVRELVEFTPPAAVTVNDADALACLDDTGGSGADVNDVALGKAVAKCQKAVEKIGTKLAGQRLGGVAKCVGALFTCAATKSGDDLAACNAKAKTTCAKAFAKNDDQSDAAKAATAKACGDATLFAAFLSPAGGNVHALLPTGLATGPRTARALSGLCTPLATIEDYEICLAAHALGFADDLATFEAPRTESLLSGVGCTLDACDGSGPPVETPGITQILDATGDGTHAFDQPRGLAVDGDGNVYVGGLRSNNVFKITPAGAVTQILDASGDGQGHGCNFLESVVVGPSRAVYVGCEDYVFKIPPTGPITTILGPTGDGTINSRFDTASALAMGSDETVYAVGTFSDNAFKITSTGAITTLVGPDGDGLGHTCDGPEDIGLDSQENAYVICTNSTTIFKVSTGGAISLFTSLGDPFKLAIFGDIVYLTNFSTVVKVVNGGPPTSVITASGDNQGHTLSSPNGIGVDGAGNLYVTGGVTNNAFKVTPAGGITQIIGPDGDGKGHALVAPARIIADSDGRIFVGGAGSDNVYKIILP